MGDRQREAVVMVELFGSVGVRQFSITFTDVDGEKLGFRPHQQFEQAVWSMRSPLIERCTAGGRNIIIRPYSPPPVLLIQLDDLDTAALARVTPVAFLILCTSPGNHQAWLAVEEVEGGSGANLGRCVKRAAGADPGATGAVRVAGTVNFKRKYAPDFPTIAIVEGHPGRIVTAGQLDAMGLVAATERSTGGGARRMWPSPMWPSYDRCVAGALLTDNHQPDISRADFTWCLIAADWGHSGEDIAARLLQLSDKARKNGEAYATLTAERAVAAAAARVLRDV